MPKVSIIIPVYNTEEYLPSCLDSICNQTCKDIEIICVDDGSTDKSLDILKQHQQRDERIKLFQQKNKGSGVARNKGIQVAKGDYIAFMDSDDWYPSNDVLEKLIEPMEMNDKLNICGGSLIQYSGNKAITKFYGIRSGFLFEKDGVIDYVDYQCMFGYWRFLYRKTLLQENNIVFPDAKRGQDLLFFVRSMVAAKSFHALKMPSYCHRIDYKTVSWNSEKMKGMLKVLRDIFRISHENNLMVLKYAVLMSYTNYYRLYVRHCRKDGDGELDMLVEELNNFTANMQYIPAKTGNIIMDTMLRHPQFFFKYGSRKYFKPYLTYIKCMLILAIWLITERGVRGSLNVLVQKM